MQEIKKDKQPGMKVFDATNYKDVDELKNSGFIPYFKFGKLQDNELKAASSSE